MKKIRRISVLLMASVLFFTNCEDKIETSKMKLDQSKEATVKVNVYAEMDKNEYGMEPAPEGTEVRLSVDYAQFNENANSGVWDTVATVNSNGVIEATVPTTNDGVDVEITGAEFTAQQVQHKFALAEELTALYNHAGQILNVDGSPLGSVINLKSKETRTCRINYNYNPTDEEHVELRLELYAVTDVEDGIDYVPQNTVITFYIDEEWIYEQQVDVEGRMDVVLPKNETVSARFEYSKKVNADGERENYIYDKVIGSYSVSPESIVSVDFGGGTSLN